MDRAKIVTAHAIVKEAIKNENLSELENYPELMQIYDEEFNKKTPAKTKVFSIRISLTGPQDEVDKKIQDITN